MHRSTATYNSNLAASQEAEWMALFNRHELWTPADLAPLLGITNRMVRYHCQYLFKQRTRYRLSPEEALRLCKYIRRVGIKARKLV